LLAGVVGARLCLITRLAKREQHMTNEPVHSESEPRKYGATDAGAGNADTDAEATVQDAVRKLGSHAAEVGEQVCRAGRQIEEQPWAAVIVTGLLGLALGVLLGRATVPAPRTARDGVDEYLPRKLRQR
jgi:hypothetical protein